jgi:lambda family phage tail tape measure protein
MAQLGALTVSLEANMARFQSEMAKSAAVTEQAMSKMAASAELARSAMRNMAAGAVGTVTGLLGVSQAIDSIRAAADRMDKFDEMSERLSISAQTLQEFAYAGKMTGVELDTMSGAIKKLQVSMFEANTGNQESAAVYKALGVAITDVNGNLRKTPDVMGDLAEVFSNLESGATKNALAIRIFGKAGADLVPFLSAGRDGIKEMTDEAHKLGGVMNDEALKAAAQFNDNLDRLSTLSQAAANSMTSKMIPAINDVIERFIEGRKAGLGFFEALGMTTGVTVERALGTNYGKMIGDVNLEIERTKKLIEENKQNPEWIQKFFGSSDKDLEALERKKSALQAMQRRVALAGTEGGAYEDQNDRRGRDRFGSQDAAVAQYLREEEARKKAAAEAERLAKEAERNAIATAKKQYDGRLQTVQAALAAEQGELQFANQYVEELRNQDLINVESYYDFKHKSIEADLDTVRRAADKEIAILKEARDSASTPQVREDYQNKISGQEALKASAEKDAAQKLTMATLGQGRAQNELRKSMEDWSRQQSANLDQMQAEVDIMGLSQVEIAKLTAARRILAEVEEQIRKAKEKGAISDADIDGYRKQAADAIARSNAIYDAGDAKRKDPYFNMRESLRQYGEEASNVGQQIGQAMQNAFHGAEDALVNFAMTGKLSFGDLARSIVADLARIQAKNLIASLTGANGSGGGAGIFGSLASLFGAAAGGSAGGAASQASTLAAWDTSAGGGLGLKLAGRRAAGGPVSGGSSYLVGEKGPEIFTASTSGAIIPNHMLGGGGGGGSITYAPVIQIDSRSDRNAVMQDVQKAVANGNAQLVEKLSRAGRI